MGKLLYGLGHLVAAHKFVVLLVWVVGAVGIGFLVSQVGADTNNNLSLPGTGSQEATDLLAENFPPQQNGSSPIVFYAKTGKVTDKANKDAITQSYNAIKKISYVYSAVSPFDQQGAAQLSKDKKTAFINVLLKIGSASLTADEAQRVLDSAQPGVKAGMQVAAGGPVGAELSTPETESSEVIGIVAAMIILTLSFGTIVAMGMPIITAIIGLSMALGLIGLLGHVASIPSIAPTIATMIGLGVGIDYALFLVTRYLKLARGGMERSEAIAQAVATAGSAIVFAGTTVVIALLSLVVAGIPLVFSLGYASAVAVVLAVLAAVTLLPALLAILGHGVEWLHLPAFMRPKQKGPDEGFWAGWARFVTGKPWIAVAAAAVILVPLIIPFFSLRLGQEDIGSTPKDTTERQAYDLVANGFGVGYNGPLLIATQLAPAATPDLEVESQEDDLLVLQNELEQEQAEGKQQQKELEQESDELKASQADLEQQQASLEKQQASLEKQAAALQKQADSLERQKADLAAQKTQLEAEEAALRAEEARLRREAEALVAEAERLARRNAELQKELADIKDEEQKLEDEIANTEDPDEKAKLEAELADLQKREQKVEDEIAANRDRIPGLRRQAEALVAKAESTRQQADALRGQAATLAEEAAALEKQANQLAAQQKELEAEGAQLAKEGDQLKAEAADLEQQADDLKAQQAQLEDLQKQADAQQKEAEALQDSLTKELTKAGGDDRATDPRLVKLQDALTATSGVVLVSPPVVNDSGDTAIYTVVPTTAPADPATADLVITVRSSVIPDATEGEEGIDAFVGGSTASNVDLASEISDKLPLVILTVILLSIIVLLLAFRSFLVPVQAALTNVLSAAASFGVLTACFQWGWGLGIVGLDPYQGNSVPIASYVPLMMFAILFGLSMDYQVFLLSTVDAHRAQGKSSVDATREGLAQSARVIAAAALIMIAVFGSFILNGDPTVKQFGVGLAVAVALAATMTLLLAPALLVLMGRWAWWIPAWLARILPDLDVEGQRAVKEKGQAPEGEPQNV